MIRRVNPGRMRHAPDVLACADVHYAPPTVTPAARAAIVTFDRWDTAVPIAHHVVDIDRVEAYEPGAFYRRELPCVRAALG
jgi:deoxyribonuclease V